MVVHAFAGIFTDVFAGLVSGVTGNLLFKSYCVLFIVFVPFFLFLIFFRYKFCIAICTITDSFTSHKHDISTAFIIIIIINFVLALLCIFP